MLRVVSGHVLLRGVSPAARPTPPSRGTRPWRPPQEEAPWPAGPAGWGQSGEGPPGAWGGAEGLRSHGGTSAVQGPP